MIHIRKNKLSLSILQRFVKHLWLHAVCITSLVNLRFGWYPRKSGVAGGIFGCVKGEMGIGIFGPALDANGNSIAGFKILELLSAQEGWSIF